MPCPHKFQKYLNLDELDFEPTTLIVGTFNPNWPKKNEAEWFYGRTSNNYFWDVMPRLYNEESLINATPTEWKQFCKRHKTAITDLISCIEDADEQDVTHVKHLSGYSDSAIAKQFKNHSFINVVQLLQKHPSIQQVYLTRGASERFWKEQWETIEQYAATNNIQAKTLLTPSGYAF